MFMPCRFMQAMERESGGLPSCQLLVPAESTSHLSGLPCMGWFSILCCINPCAMGERQILPRQTIKIFIAAIIAVNEMQGGCLRYLKSRPNSLFRVKFAFWVP